MSKPLVWIRVELTKAVCFTRKGTPLAREKPRRASASNPTKRRSDGQVGPELYAWLVELGLIKKPSPELGAMGFLGDRRLFGVPQLLVRRLSFGWCIETKKERDLSAQYVFVCMVSGNQKGKQPAGGAPELESPNEFVAKDRTAAHSLSMRKGGAPQSGLALESCSF